METLRNFRFFKALSDPTRGALLARLLETGCSCTVSEIAECCSVDLSVVSRHLATLRQAGIVEAKRDGREVRYSVCYPEVVRTLRELADHIEECCPDETSCCYEIPNPEM